MQVNDSPATGLPSAATKDEVRPVGEGPEKAGRAWSSGRFRLALEGQPEGPGCGGDESASAAAMAGWFRRESAVAAPGGAAGATAASSARAIDRVLIGAGPDGAEARIRIAAGALAGAEIQLSSGSAGNVVEARLLTHAASSRQTLSLVMDEIRLRLRERGIVLSTRGR